MNLYYTLCRGPVGLGDEALPGSGRRSGLPHQAKISPLSLKLSYSDRHFRPIGRFAFV